MSTPQTPRNPATDPRIGDRLIHKNGNLTLTVTGIGNIITWRIDGGTEPMHFNDPPAEYARLFARSLSTGAAFIPANSELQSPISETPQP